jgi:hypothetical protein
VAEAVGEDVMDDRKTMGVRIDVPPPASAHAQLSADFGRRFFVVCDTEEEFDWSRPLARENVATVSVRALPEGQAMFEAHGVEPCYVVDIPITDSDQAVDIMGPWLEQGRCTIGTQLHTWVNPPFEEEVIPHNSFCGNLPPRLERAKIVALTERIAGRFGKRPDIYRAGRYGIGPNSAAILESLDYRLDVSVRSLFRYHKEGGPDFIDFGLDPFWAGPNGALLEVPLSAVFIGHLRAFGRSLHRLSQRVPRGEGILSRTGMFTRVPLTPEGYGAAEACEAIRVMEGEGVDIFSLSFHSPSLEAGHTPYVRDAADLKTFYAWWDAVFAQFAKLGIRPTGLNEIVDAAWRARKS